MYHALYEAEMKRVARVPSLYFNDHSCTIGSMQTNSTPTQKELFITAYRENLTELVRYAQSKVGDYETGKDLVQEAFLKAWVYIRDGKEIKNMKHFLYRTLKNLIVDTYRKRKTLSLEVLLEYGHEPSMNESEHLVDMLDGKIALALIGALPPKYQEILRMKYESNLTLKEIAQRSGQSNNSVAVCVHRGLSKLKRLYASGGEKSVLV